MLIVLQEELDILSNMRPVDRDVYYYLAQRVNYDTGIVGRSRKVSYAGIAMDLSEIDEPRRAKKTLVNLNRRQVRYIIFKLIEVGLFISLSGDKKGDNLTLKRVFFEKILSMYKSVKNPDCIDKPFQWAQIEKIIPNNNNELEEKKDSRCHSKMDSIVTTSIHQYQQQRIMNKPFSMNLKWQPSKTDMDMILYRAGGFKYEESDAVWESEFVGYWWSHPEKQLTEQQWTAKLAAQLVFYFRSPGVYDRMHGQKQIENNKMQHYPAWAQIPKNDGEIVSWMQSHDYGDPPVGFDYHKLRQWLRSRVEKRLADFKRGMS